MLDVCDDCMTMLTDEGFISNDPDDYTEDEYDSHVASLAIVVGDVAPDHNCVAIEDIDVTCVCGCHAAAKIAMNQAMRR